MTGKGSETNKGLKNPITGFETKKLLENFAEPFI